MDGDERSEGSPDGNPDGSPDGNPDGSPDGNPDGSPDGNPDGNPDATMDPSSTDPSATDGNSSIVGPADPTMDDLLAKLGALESIVDDDAERRKVKQTIAMVERMPGSKAFTTRISKYTTRDVAESFVGAVIFSLPLLVEDGVFEIAEWLVEFTPGGVPVFFIANVLFVLGMTAGLLYYADFRQIKVTNPILGVIPRRYVGVLGVSLLTAFLMLLMWGRLHSEDPTTVEQVSRVTVIWAAAAFGAALGDILPGESQGRDMSDMFE